MAGEIELELRYYHNGAPNDTLTLRQLENGDIDVISSYGDRITTVRTVYGLKCIFDDLKASVYQNTDNE